MSSASGDLHAPAATCPACGRGVPGESRTCPSCGKSTLVDLRLLQSVSDHRKAYEAARRLPELHPTATFTGVKKALETQGSVVLAGVPPGPAAEALAYLEAHGIAAYGAPPAGAGAAGGRRRSKLPAIAAVVLLAAGAAWWLLRSPAPEAVPVAAAGLPERDGAAPPPGGFDPEVAARSVVQLYCAGNRGVGFYTSETAILTLRRLCEPGPVSVVRYDGASADVTLETAFQEGGSALVRIGVPRSLEGAPLPTGDPASLPNGSRVYAYGGEREGDAWTTSRVDFRRLDHEGWSYVQIAAETPEQADGGPLLDAGGAVVGVLGALPERRELAVYLRAPPRETKGLVAAEADELEGVRAAAGQMILAYAAITPGDTLGLAVVELERSAPRGVRVEAELWRHGVVVCRPYGQIVSWESYSLEVVRDWVQASTYELIREHEPDLQVWLGVVMLVMAPGCDPSPVYLDAEVRLRGAVPGYDRAVIQRGELPGS